MPRLSEKSTLIESERTLPVASRAVSVMRFAPLTRGTAADHEVVPVAVPEAPLAAFVHETPATFALSEAVPLRASGVVVVVNDGCVVGNSIWIAGGVVSGGFHAAVMVSVPLLPAASNA